MYDRHPLANLCKASQVSTITRLSNHTALSVVYCTTPLYSNWSGTAAIHFSPFQPVPEETPLGKCQSLCWCTTLLMPWPTPATECCVYSPHGTCDSMLIVRCMWMAEDRSTTRPCCDSCWDLCTSLRLVHDSSSKRKIVSVCWKYTAECSSSGSSQALFRNSDVCRKPVRRSVETRALFATPITVQAP